MKRNNLSFPRRVLRFLASGLGLGGMMVLAACSSEEMTTLAPDGAAPAFETAGTANHLTRVDRMGMPAIGTAVISSKDLYNSKDPVDDATGLFVDEIVANVAFLHAALDDDLAGLGLTPCETGDCVGQAAPFVVPDVIRIDPARPAGFPNGRRLTDPVIDITLALVLLDLNVHPVTTLIGVNPTANDKPFLDDFPYLRPANRTGR